MIRRILLLAVFASAAPLVSHAQVTCPPGQSLQPVQGVPGNYSCQADPVSAPEIGASSSIGGLAVLMGGVLMLRGRKRSITGDTLGATA